MSNIKKVLTSPDTIPMFPLSGHVALLLADYVTLRRLAHKIWVRLFKVNHGAL